MLLSTKLAHIGSENGLLNSTQRYYFFRILNLKETKSNWTPEDCRWRNFSSERRNNFCHIRRSRVWQNSNTESQLRVLFILPFILPLVGAPKAARYMTCGCWFNIYCYYCLMKKDTWKRKPVSSPDPSLPYLCM